MWWKKVKSNPQNQQTRLTKNILNQIHYAADKKQRGIQGVEGEAEGGGERKGIEGIAVGIEGMLGRGGSVALGTLGNEGKAGMVGSGGSAPGLGIVGMVGCGILGIDGNGGSVAVGKVGIGGSC
ncbi:hypothetical protein ES319_A13G076300v1 [Gossypium barbadense]|uniref:Uncharacterized protein n=1 Tax=Gossypium barbadense TaxID=3634 RepID=A0A2P5WBB7_GOSBA|nr:hypothetical protein ES319_A13G076300v1 [Gossypium barbadense]PPR88384.1 hypothetical protein GOBAR_AA32304 [Gossypium barbadense]